MSTQGASFNSDRYPACFCLFRVSFLVPLVTHRFWEFSNYLPLCSPFLFPPSLTVPIPGAHCCVAPLPSHPRPLQGHSRRVQVTVKPVQHSGTLPLMVEAILSVSIGCVTARSTKLQRGLDSYQVRQAELKRYLTKIGSWRTKAVGDGDLWGMWQNFLLWPYVCTLPFTFASFLLDLKYYIGFVLINNNFIYKHTYECYLTHLL